MANVAQLVDRLVEATGFDGADTRVRARLLREAGILPVSSRRPGEGGVETPHAVALFLGCMAAGPQTQVVDATRTLFQLCRASKEVVEILYNNRGENFRQSQIKIYDKSDPEAWPLGIALCYYANLACDPRWREEVGGAIQNIKVFRNLRSVHIDHVKLPPGEGRISETFAAAPEIWLEAEERTRRAPVLNLTIAPGQILLELADVVLHTRAERKRLKLPDPWHADTLRALGFPMIPDHPSEVPAATGSLESEAPVPLQREPAPYADPPRDDHEARTTNTPEASGERETSQGSSRAGPLSSGPKPSSKRKLR